MFGAVCSGRPIQLATAVEPTKYVLNIENAAHISHIAMFLLPNTEFDPNYTALVFFQLPNQTEFKLLGSLSSLKPSAIFKINNNNKTSNSAVLDDMDMGDEMSGGSVGGNITIGISIEPTAQAEIQLQAQLKAQAQTQTQPQKMITSGTPVNNPGSTAVLANRIVQHAYNFLGSFVDGEGKVPMKAFDSWWDKFKAKLNNNPRFLDEMES